MRRISVGIILIFLLNSLMMTACTNGKFVEREYKVEKETQLSSDHIELLNKDHTIDRRYYSPEGNNYIHEQIEFGYMEGLFTPDIFF